MKYDLVIQRVIDKSKLKPTKIPKNGPKSWKFEQLHIRRLMEMSASEDYNNSRKILLSVKEHLHKTKFDNPQLKSLSDAFNKFIDFNEKRLEKLSK
jgi:hypothetical protein